MICPTHVLDTSAILAHYFGEPGMEEMSALLIDTSCHVAVSAMTVTELKFRLLRDMEESSEAEDRVRDYLSELTVTIPVDRALAELAWQLRVATSGRLPLADALIAATARSFDAVLVHRDSHMASIPSGLVKQLVLPDRASA